MSDLTPPVAARKPKERSHHGDVFVDDYEWLRDKTNEEVLDYLRAENDYTAARTEHLKSLREAIFSEISERTLQTDLSVPARRGGYWYYTRTIEGKQYAISCRVKVEGDEPPITEGDIPGEELLLDGNQVAGDSEFFALGTVDVSPDGTLLAYSVDLTGDERFTLRIKDLSTGELLPDELTNIHYGSAWSADGSTLFYTKTDDAWRPHQVWRHALGASEDVLVLEEPDERFWVGVDLTRNEQAIMVSLGSKLTSEVWLLDAHNPAGELTVVAPRREGVEYDVEHAGDQLLITHNADAPNFSLATAPLDDPGTWTTLLEADEESRLLGSDAFAEHVMVYRRRNALTELAVMRRTGDGFTDPEALVFDEPIYSVSPAGTTSGATPATDSATRHSSPPHRRTTLRSLRASVVCSSNSPCLVVSTSVRTRSIGSGRRPRTAPACRSRWSRARTSRPTGTRPCCSTATGRTSRRWIRGSRSPGCRCSTVASCSQSRMSGVAVSSGGTGTTTGRCSRSGIPSPTSSRAPSTW